MSVTKGQINIIVVKLSFAIIFLQTVVKLTFDFFSFASSSDTSNLFLLFNVKLYDFLITTIYIMLEVFKYLFVSFGKFKFSGGVPRERTLCEHIDKNIQVQFFLPCFTFIILL